MVGTGVQNVQPGINFMPVKTKRCVNDVQKVNFTTNPQIYVLQMCVVVKMEILP